MWWLQGLAVTKIVWVQIQTRTLISFVTLGKLFNIAGLPFPCLETHVEP